MFKSFKWIGRILVKYLTAPQGCMFCLSEDTLEQMPFCKECFKQYGRLITEPCTDCNCKKLDCSCFSVQGCDLLAWLFNYKEEPVRKLIYRLKSDGRAEEFRFLAARLADAVVKKTNGLIAFDCVCYVPRRPASKRRDGYDQAEKLAKPLAEFLELPCLPLLEHTNIAGEQKQLNRAFRNVITKNRYAINRKMLTNGKLPYKKILLVDDVVTTGATLGVCARCLKQNGAKLVCGVFIAHTPRYKDDENE